MAGREELTASAVFWWANQSAGWIYLLPQLSDRHVLCVDPLPEITWLMHHLCRCITVAHSNETRAEEAGRRHFSATDRIEWIPIESLIDDRRRAGRRFDGLVIHDPQARVVHSKSRDSIRSLIWSFDGVLKTGAFIYLGVKRRFSPFDSPQDARAPRDSHPLWTHRQIVGRIRSAGFGYIQQAPYLVDGSRVVEVLAAPYTATTNAHLWRERVKEAILGPLGGRLLAPATGFVCARDNTLSSVVDDARALLGRVLGRDAAGLRLMQFRLARGDKAILAFSSSAVGAIAVISEDPRVLVGRRAEAQILAQLACLSEPVRELIPRHLGEHRLGRYTCFVLSALEGVTLDAASNRLRSLTEQAMEFLNILQLETSAISTLDEVGLGTHVAPIFDAASVRNPLIAGILGSLHSQVRLRLLRRDLPLVFTHGDYKIENIMYRLEDGIITGIIDWEHANPAALPLVDPLYLFLYNRTLHGEDWLDALEAVMDLSSLDDSERSLVSRHMESLRVPEEDYWSLAALFAAHHIGKRVSLDQDIETYKRLGALFERHVGRAPRCPVTENLNVP